MNGAAIKQSHSGKGRQRQPEKKTETTRRKVREIQKDRQRQSEGKTETISCQ